MDLMRIQHERERDCTTHFGVKIGEPKGHTTFEGNRRDTPLLDSSWRMAEAKLTTKAVKTRPSREDNAREAALSVTTEQYRD